MPPENLSCQSLSTSSFQVSWHPLEQRHLRGQLVKYNVYYQHIVRNGRGDHKAPTASGRWSQHLATKLLQVLANFCIFLASFGGSVASSSSSNLVVSGLVSGANYSILLDAETRQGHGPVDQRPLFCTTKPGRRGKTEQLFLNKPPAIHTFLQPLLLPRLLTSSLRPTGR